MLITNNTLAVRAGTELYVRDVALGLMRRGHEPVAYSTELGDVAEELRAATIPVISDLDQLAVVPDVIHGQHHLDAMTAMLHFPDTPAVYFCHGWQPWEELPPHFPSIRRYVAVDDVCRERLQAEHGIRAEDICVLRNFVDLDRFVARDPLPARPARALVFSNLARLDGYAAVIRKVCEARGIAVDGIGLGMGNSTREPETILGQYDIVFAKARAALEAMAVGAAVITCDSAGLGELITPHNYDPLRRLNFGRRSLQSHVTAETVAAQLGRYDAAAAGEVSRRVRAEAGLEAALDHLLSVYHHAIEAPRSDPRLPARQLKASSRYLRQIAPVIKRRHEAEHARHTAIWEADHLRLRLELYEGSTRAPSGTAEARRTEFDTAHGAHGELDALRQSMADVRRRLAVREAELLAIHRSRLWGLAKRAFRVKHALWTRPFGRPRIESVRAQAFELIHRENRWLSEESASGRGSTLTFTEVVRRELPDVLRRLGVRRLVDAGCGDCNWRQHTELDLDQYIGIDIVPAVVEQNRRRFSHQNWTFELMDVVDDALPASDAVLCRDCLSHLPIEDIQRAIENFRRAGAKYLLATNHEDVHVNTDIPAGGWRPINLMRAPFNLPDPLVRIIENAHTSKVLAGWAL